LDITFVTPIFSYILEYIHAKIPLESIRDLAIRAYRAFREERTRLRQLIEIADDETERNLLLKRLALIDQASEDIIEVVSIGIDAAADSILTLLLTRRGEITSRLGTAGYFLTPITSSDWIEITEDDTIRGYYQAVLDIYTPAFDRCRDEIRAYTCRTAS